MLPDLLAWRLDEAILWLRARGEEPRVRYAGPPRQPTPPPGRPCRVVRVHVEGDAWVLTAVAEGASPEDVLGDGGGPCAQARETSGSGGSPA